MRSWLIIFDLTASIGPLTYKLKGGGHVTPVSVTLLPVSVNGNSNLRHPVYTNPALTLS